MANRQLYRKLRINTVGELKRVLNDAPDDALVMCEDYSGATWIPHHLYVNTNLESNISTVTLRNMSNNEAKKAGVV